MNNREIVDYILSNKLKEEDVIKRIEYDEDYENGMSVVYLFNNKYELWDDNGKVSIFSFCDDKGYNVKYEIISKGQAITEIDNKDRQEKIQRLKDELNRLESQV